MSSARTLYLILNVIIFLLLISIGLGIFVLAMMLFGVKQDFIGMNEDVISFKTEAMLYVFTFLMLGAYVIYVVALWKLRNAIKLLLKKDFYNNKLIITLLNSGKLMVITAISSCCIDAISNVFFKMEILIGLSEKTFVYLLIIAMGLFLMLMSTVLRDAKAIKDEVDLTI